ncbi:integral peroxisomal membrane peroxin-domain-containing protein [Ampelomyces quisqualis]|uniref:Integral peroxisomal membrane peroxin-domain-containing protein n=1 Tax=Ampelomyces quisqualis TaxID=50730 RepID=A0A6A5QU54_AMPQU|nr:integral peroxisomal membrane peroxin-domain-containing protein [Ampelomyces quisqualis]
MASTPHDSLANRDTPIPVLQIHPADGSTPSTLTPTTASASTHRLSATKLKDKLQNLGDKTGRDASSRMGDNMFHLYTLRAFTPSGARVKDRRSRSYVARPNFSIPTMSSNFRRFNSRIGVAFVLQNRLIRLFTWTQPTQTLSFLFVWTFVCVDPYLLPVLPLASCLFFVMVPSFLTRHPEPEIHVGDADLWQGSLGGPPLAGARTIKPAPEFSKDFFRNMRDLQNCMEDFSTIHDAVLAFLTPLTNFSNENLSSMLYILLLLVSCLLFITAHLLPWRLIFLFIGYTLTALGHPTIQDLLTTPENEKFLSDTEHEGRSFLLSLSKHDIELEPTHESREVEIFELQHRPLHDEHGEYEAYMFSWTPYSPLSPARISGDKPRGTPFFEDVLPPRGWRWSDKKWTLDLLSREWVEDRCVTGVEVEIEGERWVTDLHYDVLESEGERERERATNTARLRKKVGSKASRDVGEQEKEVLRRAWESGRQSRKGEWRRRRWVRGVERMPLRNGE